MARNRIPRILIRPEAWQRLRLYIDQCPTEISGLGLVERRDQDFLITDVFLFEQEVSQLDTALSPADVANFLIETIESGRDPSAIKLWWHSHAEAPVFWSALDEQTAGSFSNEYMISVVGNKRGHFRSRLDVYGGRRLTLDRLPFEMCYDEDDSLVETVRNEILQKVRTPARDFDEDGFLE